MGKYFVLQLKRVARFLPLALCVMALLFGCMGLVYQNMILAKEGETQSKSTKIKVGMVGTAGDQYMQWGLAAMQFDSTALSIEMVQLEEEEAVAALERGQIAAFVVFPDNFVEDALYGNVGQLRFVCTMGASGLVSIIKEEVTGIVDSILVACQRGSYGVGDALTENELDHLWGHHVNGLALEYVDFLFDRSKMYQVESLEQENLVPFDRYMLGGLTVLLLMLGCLPFAPLYIRPDPALARLLRSKGIGVTGQVAAEFAGYYVTLAVLLAAVSCLMKMLEMLPEASAWQVFFGSLPALLMVTSLSYLLYTLSSNLIGGVLLTFMATLALSFAGGCMYPVQVFPASMQRLAQVLPSGMARQSLTALVQGRGAEHTPQLLLFGLVFLALAILIARQKTGKVRG